LYLNECEEYHKKSGAAFAALTKLIYHEIQSPIKIKNKIKNDNPIITLAMLTSLLTRGEDYIRFIEDAQGAGYTSRTLFANQWNSQAFR
jgi:hypothetical protein